MNVNIRFVFNFLLVFSLISLICFYVFNATTASTSTKAKIKNAPNKHQTSISSIIENKEKCPRDKMKWPHHVALFLMSFHSSKNDTRHLLELFSSLEKHFCTNKSNTVYVHYFLLTTNVTHLQESIHLNMKPLSRDFTILQYRGENISRQALFILREG